MTTNERQQRFLKAYRRSGKVAPAAREVGVHRDTVYAWRKADPKFVQAMADIDVQRLQKRRQQQRDWEAASEYRVYSAERREFRARLRRMLWAEGWTGGR